MKILLLRRAFGWKIGRGCRFGFSYLDARNVQIGEGVQIGHFNVVRNMPHLKMGDHSSIGRWNWITCGEFFSSATEAGKLPVWSGLDLGRDSAITSRHYIDCAGGVFVGAYTTLAGVKSTLLSHQIDMGFGAQTVRPIHIGDYCFIGSDARFTPGSSIASRSVLAMGGVVSGALETEGMLYGGVPARAIKPVEGKYFERSEGRVGLDSLDADASRTTA